MYQFKNDAMAVKTIMMLCEQSMCEQIHSEHETPTIKMPCLVTLTSMKGNVQMYYHIKVAL